MMNFLQIWIGKKPKKEYLKCMESVMDTVRKSDKYILISSTDIFKSKKKKFEFKYEWIKINDYEKKMMEEDEILKGLIELLKKRNDYTALSCRSDLIRLHYLANNSNVLYTDTDIKLKKRLTFKEKKAYFAIEKKRFAIKDSFISYNSGDKQLFQLLLEGILESCYYKRRQRYIMGMINRFWIYRQINKIYNNVSIGIEPENFEHLNMYYKRVR